MRERLIGLINQVQDCGYDMTGVVEMNYIENDTLADYLITNGITIQEWIPVAERLPNYFEHVLINAPGNKPSVTVHEAHLRKDGLWDAGLYRYDMEDVTHWMPLPQPPTL